MQTEVRKPSLPRGKEDQKFWLRPSEAARAMGVSSPRVSELLKSGRIPGVKRVREGKKRVLRTYIPNKRCILPPEDPGSVQEDAAITKWYMNEEEATKALLKAGRITREEYDKKTQLRSIVDTLGLKNENGDGSMNQLMRFKGIKGALVLLFE